MRLSPSLLALHALNFHSMLARNAIRLSAFAVVLFLALIPGQLALADSRPHHWTCGSRGASALVAECDWPGDARRRPLRLPQDAILR